MDQTIIAALIAATGTVLASFLAAKASQRHIFSPYQKDFLGKQIFEFLAPMDKIMTFHTFRDWGDIRPDLKSLVEQNYALVPPLILSELIPLLSVEEISSKQFLELQAVISSAYNWARKEVGHPYDNSKIQKGSIPSSKERDLRNTIFSALLLIIAVYAIDLGVILLMLKLVP